MPRRRVSCPNCGAPVPKSARFCPECGTRLGEDATTTAVVEPPPHETGPSPAAVSVAEPRWFGVTPPMAVFALGIAAGAVAVLLLATAHWLAGGLTLAAAFLLLAAFVEVARRKPDGAVAQASAGALGRARARAGYAVDAFTTRSRASRELARARQDVLELQNARERGLHALGQAVYDDDRKGTKRLRAELAELDARIERKETEMATIVTQARERIESRRLETRPTEMVEIPEPPRPSPDPDPAPLPEPPVPAPVPEPGPIDPVPEPYPPPDEATPPEPAQIPEPGPLNRKRGKK